MTLEDLKVFVAVYESKNLSAVARAFNRTQPAVSQHINRLEKELRVVLLERCTRGVEPTHAGDVLYEHVVEGLARISLGVKELGEIAAEDMGSLSITTGGTTIKHFMSNSVVAFRRQFPRVNLHLHSTNSHQRCVELLRSAQADLAFITIGEPIRGIQQLPVIEVPWVLVVPRSDKLAQESEISVHLLKGDLYITLTSASTSQNQLTKQLAKKGISFQARTTVDDWDTAIQFVGMGLGYAITPERHSVNLQKQHPVIGIPISGLSPVAFGWAFRRTRSLPSKAKAFTNLFAEVNKLHESP